MYIFKTDIKFNILGEGFDSLLFIRRMIPCYLTIQQ